MLINLLKRSFLNRKKPFVLIIASVSVGTAMVASLITISFEISGKISRELRAFGANILIEPKVEGLADISGQKRYLRQEDIIKAKTIFWRHNIVGIAPFLEEKAEISARGAVDRIDVIGTWYEKELPLPGKTDKFSAGAKTVSPWWNIDGAWPDSSDKTVIGTSLAGRLGVGKGDNIFLDGRKFEVSGILETGGKEDQQVFMDMESLQNFKGMKGKVSKVLVSALTTPMDDFAYKDPKTMSRPEYEKWYCTGYVTSIAKQLEEAFQGSRGKPVWQVAETEGRILEQLTWLIYILCAITVMASSLGVSTTMIMSLMRRTEEIGLMKAIGADSINIAIIFISEGIVVGVIGGLGGYLLSLKVVQYIGTKVFSAGLEHRAILMIIAVGSALLISVAGSLLPVRRALRIKPAVVLKGAE